MDNKKILITTEDGIAVYDKSNMGTDNNRRKVELPHEALFNQYQIDPTKLSTGQKLKPISKEWIGEIIVECAKSTGFEIVRASIDLNERSVSIEVNGDTAEFSNMFNINIFKTTNNFLESKKENPTNFMRVFVMTIAVDQHFVNIRY